MTLLEIARKTLQQDIIPNLQGDARFKALMVANALAIEIRAGNETPAPAFPYTISGDIRAGKHDDDHALATQLRQYAMQRCRVSAPKAI